MSLKVFHTMFIGLSLLLSNTAHAGVTQFTESFAGYFNKEVDPDTGLFKAQYAFDNGNATLSTEHLILEDYFFYVGFGTFSRTDSAGVLSGTFDFSSGLPDYDAPGPANFLPITGTFISGIGYGNLPIPGNTGAYRFGGGTGLLKGFIDSSSNYTSFTIDWTVVTPDAITPVPEPSTLWLFAGGLLLLVNVHHKNNRQDSLGSLLRLIA